MEYVRYAIVVSWALVSIGVGIYYDELVIRMEGGYMRAHGFSPQTQQSFEELAFYCLIHFVVGFLGSLFLVVFYEVKARVLDVSTSAICPFPSLKLPLASFAINFWYFFGWASFCAESISVLALGIYYQVFPMDIRIPTILMGITIVTTVHAVHTYNPHFFGDTEPWKKCKWSWWRV